MSTLRAYWTWLKSHPIFLLVSLVLGTVFVLPILIPVLKKTALPGTDRIPDVVPTATSPVQKPAS